MATSYSPSIVTKGLQVCLDAFNSQSYPGSGTTWYDVSGNGNNGTFNIGSPSFSTFDNKRSIRFSNQNKNVYSGNHDGFLLSSNPGISTSGTSFTFKLGFIK